MDKPLKIFLAAIVCSIILPAVTLYAGQSAICLDCHDDMAPSLAGTVHQIHSDSLIKSPVTVECITCHDGWEVHVDDPSAENIMRGDKMAMLKEAELCGRCHQTPHQVAMVSTDPHNKTDLTCSSCHIIHSNWNDNLVKEDMANYCLSCHFSTTLEFERRSAHPLNAMAVECTDCHNLSSTENPMSAVGFNWVCQDCHDDQAGPFLYEHAVVYNHLVDGGGCIECHEPHGSVNDRLLRQPGNGTCLQCHSLPPGHLTNHSGLGAKLECVQCHTQIHGSYESRLLLDPDLGVKLFPDCYQSGCHNLNGN